MTPEVREIYDALIAKPAIFGDARARYEKLRARIIEEVGYNAFWDRQHEAFVELGRNRP
jgi:hypothetical protein